MKRFHVTLATALVLSLGLSACDRGTQVIVQAAAEDEVTGEARPLADLPIRFLPYDRDEIFDSLEAAHPEPEPQAPPELVQQQQEMQRAQAEWQAAESRWNEVREELRQLSNRLQQMQEQGLRGTPQYQQAFREFENLDEEEDRLERQSQEAFQRFDELQRTVISRADSVRAVRDAWADRVFADYDQVVEARLEQLGREEVEDTTNAAGVVRTRLPQGRWWVHTRYTLPFSELYWNVPIDVSGDSTRVILNRENAEERPLL